MSKTGNRQRIGKRVNNALYIHCCALSELDESQRMLVERAKSILPERQFSHNVIKITAKPGRVSFLQYEDFEDHPFPALLESILVDLEKRTLSRKSYRNSKNPPILHRKELLLPDGHPRKESFGALTKLLVDQGLFEKPHLIGHRNHWVKALKKSNIQDKNIKEYLRIFG